MAAPFVTPPKGAEWELIVEKTLGHEGGYVDDPLDPGGETNWGISKRQYPDLDIKHLTRNQAIEIYKRDYYDPLVLPSVWPLNVKWKLFDVAVNMGLGTAQKFREAIKEQPTVFKIVELQMKRYVEIVVNRPTSLKFLKGWTSRAFDTGRDLTEDTPITVA